MPRRKRAVCLIEKIGGEVSAHEQEGMKMTVSERASRAIKKNPTISRLWYIKNELISPLSLKTGLNLVVGPVAVVAAGLRTGCCSAEAGRHR